MHVPRLQKLGNARTHEQLHVHSVQDKGAPKTRGHEAKPWGFAFRFASLTLDDDDDDDAADAGRTALHARWTTRLVLVLLPLKLPLTPVPGRSARMTCGCAAVLCVCAEEEMRSTVVEVGVEKERTQRGNAEDLRVQVHWKAARKSLGNA